MNKKRKAEFLYMLLTTWLLENHKDIYEEYLTVAYEEHAENWRDYWRNYNE